MSRVIQYLSQGEALGMEEPALKFLTYSLHDAQIGNMIVWLTQRVDTFDYIPYAASVIFELKYSKSCL